MSATKPPFPNVNTFNNNYWNITTPPARETDVLYPSELRTETLVGFNATGFSFFNQIPSITATDPSLNNSSNTIPTTRWVQDLILSNNNPNLYNYPQVWKQSLMRETFTGSSTPTYPQQSVDIILPFSSSLPTTDIYGFNVKLRIEYTITGRQEQTNLSYIFFQLLSSISYVTICLNLRSNPATFTTTITGNNLLTAVTLQYSLFNPNVNYSLTPCSVGLTPLIRNGIRVTFNCPINIGNAYENDQRDNVYNVFRSVEILGSNLGGWNNSSNYDTFNSSSIPNSVVSNYPYITPVSNNTY